MNNSKNNQQSQAGFCRSPQNGKQQQRPTVDLKLSDLYKTTRFVI